MTMKLTYVLILALLTTLMLACSPDGPSSNNQSTVTNTTNLPAVAATGAVQHYICPNNCAGSGGPAAGACPVCGTDYIHNQAYHNQSSPTANTLTADPNAPISPIMQNQPQEANSPATNSAGVFHYTCSAGCGGGGAAAGACPQCGSELAHNQAYHNQSSTPTINPNGPISPIIQTQPQLDEANAPAINSAGVFHYTCSAGCGGGGAAAGACPQCGAELAHNQAYHQ